MTRKRKKASGASMRNLMANVAGKFIVYAVTCLSKGVIRKATLKPCIVSLTEEHALTRCEHKFKFIVGVSARTAEGKEYYSYSECVSERCIGASLNDTFKSMAQEHIDEVGDEYLTSFYFATSDLDFEFSDDVVYRLLVNAGAWDGVLTQREFIINTYADIKEFLMNTDLSKTQVGGDHYSSMQVQPQQVITTLDMPWCLANAVKYIARFERKNGSEDLQKAWDYIARCKQDGLVLFKQRRLSKAKRELWQTFVAQFPLQVQEPLNAIFEAFTTRYEASEDKFDRVMHGVLCEINTLHKVVYKCNAYQK